MAHGGARGRDQIGPEAEAIDPEGPDGSLSGATGRSRRWSRAARVVPRLLAIGVIQRDRERVLIGLGRFVGRYPDQLGEPGELRRLVPRCLAELKRPHVEAVWRDGLIVAS